MPITQQKEADPVEQLSQPDIAISIFADIVADSWVTPENICENKMVQIVLPDGQEVDIFN
ncbi:hypothetical protein D3C77_816540 [compost metagenome]